MRKWTPYTIVLNVDYRWYHFGHFKLTICKKAYKQVKNYCVSKVYLKKINVNVFLLKMLFLKLAWKWPGSLRRKLKRLKIYKCVDKHQTMSYMKRSGELGRFSPAFFMRVNALIWYLYIDALWPLYVLL